MNCLLQQGIDFFNQGQWYEAHEVWEDLWRETEGEARGFYQGLVQLAVGLHHISGGNLRGGKRVLDRGIEHIRAFPDRFMGIDNERLQQDILTRADPTSVRIRYSPE